MKQRGFYFNPSRCVKCHACEIACKLWNGVEIGPRWRTVVKVGQGKFPNVTQINVSMACQHCGKPKCLSACPVGAITKRVDDGIVEVNPKVCVGCGFCTWACPFNAPQIGADGKMQKCHFCADRPESLPRACEEVCPVQAIKSGVVNQIAADSKEVAATRLLGELRLFSGEED